MQFNPRENITELVQIDQYLKQNPSNPILPNRRRFNYLVYEAKDRSFVECQGAVQVCNKWFVWPAGLENYVEQQINKTLRTHAA
jgi:hypothetical protein